MLTLFLSFAFAYKPLEIEVRSLDGRSAPVPDMVEEKSVVELKRAACQALGAKPADVHVTYAGKVLKPDKTLKQYQIQDGSIVGLVPKANRFGTIADPPLRLQCPPAAANAAANQAALDGVSWGPVDGAPCRYQATLIGPANTPYAGGVYLLDLVIPADFPARPPIAVFKTKIYHPNISSAGKIGMKVAWTDKTLGAYFTQLNAFLDTPDLLRPVDPMVAWHYVNDRAGFDQQAAQWNQQHAK